MAHGLSRPSADLTGRAVELLSAFLTAVVRAIGVDPFIYLVVTIVSMAFWIYSTVIGDYALAGAAVWIRRGALVAAAGGAVLFAHALAFVV